MRSLDVDEWAVRIIHWVGVHQGFVLSSLLFILVLEASRKFRTGVPWELLYADDLVLITDTQEEWIAWKAGMESNGLRNMKNTKFMVSGVDLDVLKRSGKCQCVVCCKGVGNNSIECSQCKLWVHKKCSGITKRLAADANYICPRCEGESRPICSGGRCDSAIAARCCVAWGKFRKLLPVLTSRHLSPKVRGKVYMACVRSAMLHGSETGASLPNWFDHQKWW